MNYWKYIETKSVFARSPLFTRNWTLKEAVIWCNNFELQTFLVISQRRKKSDYSTAWSPCLRVIMWTLKSKRAPWTHSHASRSIIVLILWRPPKQAQWWACKNEELNNERSAPFKTSGYSNGAQEVTVHDAGLALGTSSLLQDGKIKKRTQVAGTKHNVDVFNGQHDKWHISRSTRLKCK